MHKQNARSRLLSEYVCSRLRTPSLRGYPPRARAGRNRVCGMRIHRDPQRVTHAHCIGSRKASINAQHSVVPTLGHRRHQTLCGIRSWLLRFIAVWPGDRNRTESLRERRRSMHNTQSWRRSDTEGTRHYVAITLWLPSFAPVGPGDRNRTQNLPVPSRSRSYGLHGAVT